MPSPTLDDAQSQLSLQSSSAQPASRCTLQPAPASQHTPIQGIEVAGGAAIIPTACTNLPSRSITQASLMEARALSLFPRRLCATQRIRTAVCAGAEVVRCADAGSHSLPAVCPQPCEPPANKLRGEPTVRHTCETNHCVSCQPWGNFCRHRQTV